MSADVLPGLAGRLQALRDEPVASHPDALEDIHRQLVRELDDLAAAGSAG